MNDTVYLCEMCGGIATPEYRICIRCETRIMYARQMVYEGRKKYSDFPYEDCRNCTAENHNHRHDLMQTTAYGRKTKEAA